MKIRQYVYFALHSESLSPDDIAGRVGMRPDKSRVRGARQLEPPRPPRNMWAIECDARGLTIDEQAASVLKRVAPFQAAVKQLVDAGEVNAVLQLVRYFGVYLAEKDGEDEHIDVTPDGLEKLTGQHQLLGWQLDASSLALLAALGAELSADEYG